MSQLVVHPYTEQQLADLTAAPPHAIALIGPAGTGKQQLAVRLCETVLGLPVGGFAAYGYGLTIAKGGKTIGIETVRELEHFLSRKVPSQQALHRAVIIADAHLLTVEAQNALLKTLEEPPAGTLIILTAVSEKALLPTIRSRLQIVAVKRPPLATVEAHFSGQGRDEQAVKRAMAMSGGLPGLAHALLSEEDHPLLIAAAQARELLGASMYERLLMVEALSKDRQQALALTAILQQMAHVSLSTATGAAAQRWQRVLQAAYRASEALSVSAQPKLVCTKLMLDL